MVMPVTSHQHSEHGADRVQPSRNELIERIALAIPKAGTTEPLDGVRLRRESSPTELGHGTAHPSFCVIAQGGKEVRLGDRSYRYDPAHFLIATTTLPIASRVVEASGEHPYLGLVLRLDPNFVGSVMVEAGRPAPRERS